MTITELAIKRPTLVVVVFTVLAVLGLFGYYQLGYELLPKMSIPVDDYDGLPGGVTVRSGEQRQQDHRRRCLGD
jgi:hypothetical protein